MVEAIYTRGYEKSDDIFEIVKEYNYKKEDMRFDDEIIHVIVYDQSKPVATGYLSMYPEYVINNVFVKNEFRRMHYGDLVVKMLIHKGFELGADEIVTKSPKSLIDFFKKIGFYIKEENNNECCKLGINQSTLKKCK